MKRTVIGAARGVQPELEKRRGQKMPKTILDRKAQGVSQNIIVTVGMAIVVLTVVAFAVSEILGALTPTENSIGENIKTEIENRTPLIFKLLLVTIIIMVVVGMLRYFGAI